jgi:hypothetical protein
MVNCYYDEVSDMKVKLDEIKVLTPRIWTEGREWMWMAKVWEILEKKGRTTYETQTEKLQIYMLAVSAAAIYMDYSKIVFVEGDSYDSLYWDLERIMSENEIFFLYGRTETDDPPESAREALTILESDSRADLMYILTRNMRLADINLGLYYSAVTPNLYEYEDDDEDDDEEDTHDEEERTMPFDTYDGYWKMIAENTTELIDLADFANLMPGTEWINENAYQIGTFD